MSATILFVDTISASPTTRLNLNDTTRASGFLVDEDGIDLSPPPLNEVVISTMLRDGETIPAAAYGNRVLRIPLVYVGTATSNAAATALSNLGKELNRPTNYLKVQLDGATNPVFFRTFRHSYALAFPRLLIAQGRAMLEIPAEPFAIGLKQTVATVSVKDDPTVASGYFMDVSGVLGDVETPAILDVSAAPLTYLAIRDRGTPSALTWYRDSPNTGLTDVTSVADAASTAGDGNVWNISFASAAYQARLQYDAVPGAGSSVEYAGTYRAIALMRSTVASTVYTIGFDSNDTFTWSPGADLAFRLIDLGTFTLPRGGDPSGIGYGAKPPVTSVSLTFAAGRTSGTGNLRVDTLFWLPADSALSVIDMSGLGAAPDVILDTLNDAVYAATAGVLTNETARFTGMLPMLEPGQTNRLFFLRESEIILSQRWIKGGLMSVDVSYYPRYLVVA